MSTPVRYTNGVTNVENTKALGQYLALDPTKVHEYFSDFDVYAAGDWTVTETDAGSTEALTDGDGGQLLLTVTAADNDCISMQHVGEAFLMALGKKAWFKARFKVSDATQSDVLFGLVIRDTSPLINTDGVFIRKDDGDTNIDFIVNKNSTESSVEGVGTLVSDTFISVGWYWDGVDTFAIFVNDAQVGTLSYTAASFPDDEELTVTMHIQNGEAVAKTMTVDYILASKER